MHGANSAETGGMGAGFYVAAGIIGSDSRSPHGAGADLRTSAVPLAISEPGARTRSKVALRTKRLDPEGSADARITRFSLSSRSLRRIMPDPPERVFTMTTISLCILNNLRKYLHNPMSYSSWESACPSAWRVGVRRPVLFDN
jgi:hypothetical protein